MATWGGTKTDYTPDNAVVHTDINRREGNAEYLKDEADGLRQDFDDNIDQGVKIADSPVFSNMASGSNNNQDVRTTAAPTFATVDTGHGANEVYAMDQDLETTDRPEFIGIKLTTPSAYSQTISASPTVIDEGLYTNLYFTIVSTGGLGTTVALDIEAYTGGAWVVFYTMSATSNATTHAVIPILHTEGTLLRYTRTGVGTLSVTGYKY